MPYVDCVSELSILDYPPPPPPPPSLPNTPQPPNVDCPFLITSPPSSFSSVDSIHCSFNCDYVEDDLLKTCGIFKGFPPSSIIISTFVYRYKSVILKHRKARRICGVPIQQQIIDKL